MLFFKKRRALLELAGNYRLPKIYDLLNIIKGTTDTSIACTDGKSISVNIDAFNDLEAKSQFFILCHEVLHILYHHLDKDYYPEDVYSNRELLNICQDVIINTFLEKRLKYREPHGIYIDNLSEALYNRGCSCYRFWDYKGLLTTKDLYNFLNFKFNEDELQQMLEDLEYDSSDERKEEDGEGQSSDEKQRIKEAVDNVIKNLRISDKMIDDETSDRHSSKTDEHTGITDTAGSAKIISSKDMIEYINTFIGNNAIERKRSRTYSRPSRRIKLKDDILAAGYKRYKNIKKISIYLDVSGSMNSYLVSSLYKTLKELHKKIEFDFYTFTTQISQIDIKNTKDIYVGGGTDIKYVLQYIDDNKQDVAIMITDCDDRFSLKNVQSNLMIYTNNKTVRNNNPLVKLTYFRN